VPALRGTAGIVLDEFIRFDEAMTGRTVAGRDGLADLIRLAKAAPKALRLHSHRRYLTNWGRYLPDVLREMRLAHALRRFPLFCE